MPAINIQNVGSGATAVGEPVHHANLAAFATWLHTRDLVANDEIVIAKVFNSETITGNVEFYCAKFNSSCYFIIEPADGYSHIDLNPSGPINYALPGIELTRMVQGNSFAVAHGGWMRKFKLKFTGTNSTGLRIGRLNTATANGIYDARLTQCLIMVQCDGATSYPVSTNTASTAADITDNVFFNEGSAGYSILIRENNCDRNVFINTGAAIGRTVVALGFSGARMRDNVFYQCGPKPVARDSYTPAIFDNNYTSEAVTGPASGYVVGSLAMLRGAADARPAPNGVLIGAGSAAARYTNDIRDVFRGAAPDVGAAMETGFPLPQAPDTTITSIEVYGQRVTVKGTFTNNVTTSSVYLNPAAVPNGAIKTAGTITYVDNTFTAVFTNVTPGNYLTPSIILTNQGGTGVSSGGQPTTMPMPLKPEVTIFYQYRNGQHVFIEGKFKNIPNDASVVMYPAEVPNGAVTKGPQAIPISEDGSFTVILNTVAPGDYDAPIVSATNFAGTGFAVGEKMGRIYLNGTQPPGLVPAVILPPYAAPAFNTPAVPINGEVTVNKLLNLSNTAKTNVPFTWGQLFEEGDIGPNHMLVGRTSGKADIPLQFNAKSTHRDGSVRHAVISCVVPSMLANEERAISLTRVASGGASTLPVASSAATGAGLAVKAKIVIGGVEYTASPNAQLAANNASQVWIAGEAATEWIVTQPFATAGGSAHPTMTAQFSTRYYPAAGHAKIIVAFEDTDTFRSLSEIIYDAAIEVNGVNVYTEASVKGVPNGRYGVPVTWGAQHSTHVKQDPAYLILSRIVPPFDLRTTISEETLEYWRTTATPGHKPFTYGTIFAFMGATGGRADIGPVPYFDAASLISQDKRALDLALAYAFRTAGAWSTNQRDLSGGPGHGRALNTIYFPYTTRLGTSNDSINPATKVGERSAVPGYGQDTAHQPSFGFMAYALTGDFYHLETLQFWANYCQSCANPGYRKYHIGLNHSDQIRAVGWTLRTWGYAAAMTPDSHPDKAMFYYWIKNNMDYFNRKYTDNPNASPFHYSEEFNGGFGYHGETSKAPWQDDYQLIGVATCANAGSAEAKRLLKFRSKFAVDRLLIGPSGCWIHAAAYAMKFRDGPGQPFYTSWSQVIDVGIPSELWSLPCNSPERVAKMNELMGSGRDSAWVQGEMTGYASSTAGYPSILQAAVAYIASYGYTDADLAWDLIDSRTVKPNYSAEPQFSLAPLSTVESYEDTAPEPVPVTTMQTDIYSAVVGTTLKFGRD